MNREKVNNLAMEHFFESIFGNNHPYGRQIVPEDFENMNPPLLKDFHAANYTPEKLAIIISGKIHGRTLDLLTKHFGENFAGDVYIEELHNYISEYKGGAGCVYDFVMYVLRKRKNEDIETED